MCVCLQWAMKQSTGLCTEDIWSSMSLNQSSLSFTVRFLLAVALVGCAHCSFLPHCHKKGIPQINSLSDSWGDTGHSFQVDHNFSSSRTLLGLYGSCTGNPTTACSCQFFFSVLLCIFLTPSVGSFPDAQLPSKRIIGPKNYEFLTSKREDFQEYLQVAVRTGHLSLCFWYVLLTFN